SNRVGRSHNHDAEDSSGSSGDDDEKERARIMKGGPSTLKTRYRDVVPITARNKKDIFHGVFRDDEHIQQFLDTIPVDDTPGVNGVDYEDMADFILEHGVLNAQRKTVDPALGPDPPAWSFSLPSRVARYGIEPTYMLMKWIENDCVVDTAFAKEISSVTKRSPEFIKRWFITRKMKGWSMHSYAILCRLNEERLIEWERERRISLHSRGHKK
ncbi:hypothetical protein ADUPG1_011489, partial [Aduncisulcus paluster]